MYLLFYDILNMTNSVCKRMGIVFKKKITPHLADNVLMITTITCLSGFVIAGCYHLFFIFTNDMLNQVVLNCYKRIYKYLHTTNQGRRYK